MANETSKLDSQKQIYVQGIQENAKSANQVLLYNQGSAALPQMLKNFYEMIAEMKVAQAPEIENQKFSITDTDTKEKSVLVLKAEDDKAVAETVNKENETESRLATYDKDGYTAHFERHFTIGSLTVPDIKADIQYYLDSFKASFPGGLYYTSLGKENPHRMSMLVDGELTPVQVTCTLTRQGNQQAFLDAADKYAKDTLKALRSHDPVWGSHGSITVLWSDAQITSFLKDVVSQKMTKEDIINATMTGEDTHIVFDTKTGGMLMAYPSVEKQLDDRNEIYDQAKLDTIYAELQTEKEAFAARIENAAHIINQKERAYDFNNKTDIDIFMMETYMVTGTTLDQYGQILNARKITGPSIEIDFSDPKSIERAAQTIAEHFQPTITLESCSLPLFFNVGAERDAVALTYRMKPNVVSLLVSAVKDGIAKFVNNVKQGLAKGLYKLADLIGIKKEREVMNEFVKAANDTVKGLNLVSMVVVQETLADVKPGVRLDQTAIAAKVADISAKAGWNAFENTIYMRLLMPIQDCAQKYQRSISLYVCKADSIAVLSKPMADRYDAKITCKKDGNWILNDKETERDLGSATAYAEKGRNEVKVTVANLVTSYMVADLAVQRHVVMDIKNVRVNLGDIRPVASVEVGGLSGKLMEAANKLSQKPASNPQKNIRDDFGIK